MHNRFDQFVKNVLREMFDPLGTSQRELEISTDAQRIDFFFTPAIPAGALSDDASQPRQQPGAIPRRAAAVRTHGGHAVRRGALPETAGRRRSP